ncbi:40S ribosomal protein S12, mitochondrial-like isoform X2 [Papaver somniferum]|uniref:40S ribosomal protein S12, mitochondrial-like isoform X2 n=1 Tax=Papaver somniferum TaxID=3469 RepID=UPI000E6F4D36|nr:40S ribosomal protein S12, mitochondrial-like isoform X2 [Papaver somniferum]
MLGCVQHSYFCCIDPIRYSGKQLHSNGNSGLLGMRPVQNSGHWMRHPLLKQGNHYRCVVKKNTFEREKTLFSGYPFSCLSGLEKDSWMAQQSKARLIDFLSPAMGHSQDAHPESSLSIPAITSALKKTKLTSKAMMDLASQDGLVYISGPTYASSTVTSSSINCKLPPSGLGRYPIPKRRMGVSAFGNVATRRIQRHVCFATVSQLIRHGRAKKQHKAQGRRLSNCPQKQGVCLTVQLASPKKPNSGNRKTARVRLTNGKDVTCLIPGEGHNLQEHSIVLVGGGGVKDLPGVNYHCIRGIRDLKGVPDRKRGRSQYGTKKPRKTPEKQNAN